VDEPITVAVTGLQPGAHVTISAENATQAPIAKTSASAVFVADTRGRVDLTTMAPVSGSYSGVSAMGLFWSGRRDPPPSPPPAQPPVAVTFAMRSAQHPPPQEWHLTARVNNQVVATATVLRRALSPDVRITPVLADGVYGVFYQPPGSGPHPAIMYLYGSGAPGAAPPEVVGGFASRGYVVLALAYFGAEGLPPTWANMPLEYFKTALDWLAKQPSVDAGRLGLVGWSLGAQAGLIAATMYPEIKALVAIAPIHVVLRGAQGEPAFTLKGQPIPTINPTREVAPEAAARYAGSGPPTGLHRILALLENKEAAARAAIPVERSNAAMLLISGKADTQLPATLAGYAIIDRLTGAQYPHAFEHLAYDDAGHAILRPFRPFGDYPQGTPAANAHAEEQSWQAIHQFLASHLNRGRR
jgi:dienelactone hydrolase